MRTTLFVLLRRAVLAALLGSALSACMSSSPYWDAHFGEAARASFASQVIDPNAGDHPQPRESYSGNTAVSAMSSYDKAIAEGKSGDSSTSSLTGINSK